MKWSKPRHKTKLNMARKGNSIFKFELFELFGKKIGHLAALRQTLPTPASHTNFFSSLCSRSPCLTFSFPVKFVVDHKLQTWDTLRQQPIKWKYISFEIKKEVIVRKEKGEGNTAIGRSLGLAKSNVKTKWCNKDEIEVSINFFFFFWAAMPAHILAYFPLTMCFI